jgi:DNA-binding NarL/FixJ family response regulator
MMPRPPAEDSRRRTVFIVDDHPVFREGLVRIINQEQDLVVCGDAADAREALRLAESLKPDLVIIDISLEGTNGIDLAKTLRSRLPRSRLLVVSMHPESLYGERALRAGVHGYVMKRESGSGLLAAIRRVLDGKTHVSLELNEAILRRVADSGRDSARSAVERLSDRELEVFQLIGQGFGSRQISERLNVSMKTVETHREHIKEKLNLDSTTELVQRAIHWIHHEHP